MGGGKRCPKGISSCGREPLIDGLGLEKVGIVVNKGRIVTIAGWKPVFKGYMRSEMTG